MNRLWLFWPVMALAVIVLSGCAASGPAPVQTRPIPGEPSQETRTPTAPGKSQPSSPEKLPRSGAQAAEPTITWAWPLPRTVVATYSAMNKGLDFDTERVLPVRAAADGVVSYVGNSIKSYGNMVVIKHGPDYLSVYANNGKVFVKEGENVKRGQRIAETGGSVSAKWHFEIRHLGKPVDPDILLPKKSR